ncbi:hypothetical protein [Kutzneria sp. CA-103260]|uniref:hypothetical protein n=1 Tax=Kutzneria sp. CA-103260 TaxID=2802641 RepID=UPI001BA92128|nr:hypothetical protein [Kutzneria sp. CA-103260]QUQ69920.1 hypothetical protein JJ691_76880 [Kutzneria sp. CA-103260]
MSWQEELQQLDSELAQGRVTPEDYRLRRDQLLGVAQGQQPPQTPPGGQPQQQPAEPQQPQQPASSPFGQPFRWQPPANQQNQGQTPPETPSESTQVMRPIADAPAGDSAERTQVVRSTGDSAERTQVVPNTGGFTPGPQTPPPWQSMPQQGMPPQGGPQEYGAAPWSNELPPDFGKASWPLQGPEVFDSGKSSKNTGKIIAIAVAAVLVLGLAGGIYYFTAGQSHDATTTTSTTAKPTTTTSAPPPLPAGPFVQVPGKQVYNVNYSIADAVTNHVPTEQEVALLKNSGAIQVASVVTENNGMHEGIWAFQAGTGVDPKAILNAIDNFYALSKYQQVTSGIPTGVVARTLAGTGPDGQTAFRAHYISNGYVIRVETYGPDAAGAEKAFRDLLKTETQKYAPAP